MFKKNMQETVGVIGSIVVMLLPLYFHFADWLSVLCILIGAWAGGTFSTILLSKYYGLQASATPSRVKYKEGSPVMVIVNEGASQQEIVTKVQQKATALGGNTAKKGEDLYILVGEESRLVRLTYQSGYRNEPVIESSRVDPSPEPAMSTGKSFSY